MPRFDLTPATQSAIVAEYLQFAEFVVDVPPSGVQCRDPDDAPILDLALAADVDALVTGDGDMLDLDGEFNFPIVRPGPLATDAVRHIEVNVNLQVSYDEEFDILRMLIPGRSIATSGRVSPPLIIDFGSKEDGFDVVGFETEPCFGASGPVSRTAGRAVKNWGRCLGSYPAFAPRTISTSCRISGRHTSRCSCSIQSL